MDTIGERIAWIIRENGLKKVQFAARVGIHQSYVTQLIKGKNPPSEALIKLISSEFHIREAWLRDGEEPMRESEAPDALDACLDSYGMPREFRSLFQAYAELNETQREAVLLYVRKCAEIVTKRHADKSATVPAMAIAEKETETIPPLAKEEAAEVPEKERLSEEEIRRRVAEYEALLRGRERLKDEIAEEKMKSVLITSGFRPSGISGKSGTNGSAGETGGIA